MHHRTGSRNWVESDKNLRKVGWLGCQDGFVNLDDVIWSGRIWIVLINVLLYPEVSPVVERQPGEKDIVLGLWHSKFRDVAVHVDAADFVSGFFRKPHGFTARLRHNRYWPAIIGRDREFRNLAVWCYARNFVAHEFGDPHVAVRPILDIDGNASYCKQSKGLDFPSRCNFAHRAGRLAGIPDSLSVVANGQSVRGCVNLSRATATIQAHVVFRDDVAIPIQPRDLSRSLQSYPESTRPIELDAMRAAACGQRIGAYLAIHTDLHEAIVVLPRDPKNVTAILVVRDFMRTPLVRRAHMFPVWICNSEFGDRPGSARLGVTDGRKGYIQRQFDERKFEHVQKKRRAADELGTLDANCVRSNWEKTLTDQSSRTEARKNELVFVEVFDDTGITLTPLLSCHDEYLDR